MNIKTFTYTKNDGNISTRVVNIIVEPNTMYEGIDITPLEPVEQAMYAVAVDEAKSAYMAAIAKINNDFEVRNQYRRFDPKKMTNIVDEEI